MDEHWLPQISNGPAIWVHLEKWWMRGGRSAAAVIVVANLDNAAVESPRLRPASA